MQEHAEPEHDTEDFSDDGRGRDPADSPSRHRHQQQGEGDVGEVDGNLQHQAEVCAGSSDHRAEDGIVRQRERGGEDTDGDIGAGGGADRPAPAHQRERHRGDRRAQRDEHRADADGKHERPAQGGVDLAIVARAECLRRQSGGRHAQGAEGPEQEVEHHRAEGDAAEQGRIAQPADHRRVDEAEQRRRHMRQHHRRRDDDEAPVARLHPPRGDGRAHRLPRSRTRSTSQIGTTTMAP